MVLTVSKLLKPNLFNGPCVGVGPALSHCNLMQILGYVRVKERMLKTIIIVPAFLYYSIDSLK